jgi:hypothetical protein
MNLFGQAGNRDWLAKRLVQDIDGISQPRGVFGPYSPGTT